ncbi:MAG TPA: NAD(P)-dependent oxidoreductase, partial [Thermomicrobiales bacterium]|nr:NAD(P)-dependent oxidoreductase [Thermomicrobiales bacterium]
MATAGKRRVLVTGADGVIGRAVRQYLGDRYDLRCLTHRPAAYSSHVADVADLAAIAPAFEGIDCVVHLAASPDVATPWSSILPNNLIGTYNVFEAARQAGVPAVVFASSNHTIGMNEIDNAPAIYALDDPRVFDHQAEPRPDSLYGVSKLFGEAVARLYVDRYGMRAACLRIGTVREDDRPGAPEVYGAVPALVDFLTEEERRERLRATWLSRRDCAQLISRAIEADDVPWAVVYGISNNPRQFWDLEHARRALGYEPEDSAPV